MAKPGARWYRQPMQPTRPDSLVAYSGPTAAFRGRARRRSAAALLAMFCCPVMPAAALEGPAQSATIAPAFSPALDQTTALRDSQAAVGRSIGDYTLQDREGRPVRLSSYRGKPLLVSFIYTGCFQVCPATTQALQKVVSVAQNALGEGHGKFLVEGPRHLPAAQVLGLGLLRAFREGREAGHGFRGRVRTVCGGRF